MSLIRKSVCWKLTRNDGITLLGTTSSRDVRIPSAPLAGLYKSESGFAATAVRVNADLSVDNLEASGAFFSTAVQALDIEAGLYDGAAVTIFEVTDAGATQILRAGTLGQTTRRYEDTYTFEVRGVTQLLAQPFTEAISKKCRVKQLGDARCKLDLTAYTFTGTVLAVQGTDAFTDAGLAQSGPVVEFVGDTDTLQAIPANPPYLVPTIPPSGGSFVADMGVTLDDDTALSRVGGAPDDGQYQVDDAGNYSFNEAQAGRSFFRSYTYTYGYFVDGTMTWLSGANKGFSNLVRNFSPAGGGNPASLQLFLPQVMPIAAGDTYRIVAGCNRLFGTCRDRFANLPNMRAEPYAPGPDALARVLS